MNINKAAHRETQVRDLTDDMTLECTCLKCGHTYQLTKQMICTLPDRAYLYLDEVERRVKCKARGCNGQIDMIWIQNYNLSAFIGGMA